MLHPYAALRLTSSLSRLTHSRAPKTKLFLRHQPRQVNDNIEMNKVRPLFWVDTDYEADYGP